MSTNLMAASTQWATRPADERFWNLEEMKAAMQDRRDRSVEAAVPVKSLQVDGSGQNLTVQSPGGDRANLTNWSFSQLCARVGAPAAYLTTLPGEMAAPLVNYGLAKIDPDDTKILIELPKNYGEAPTIRATTSEVYGRYWDDQVCSFLMRLRDFNGWRTPPARPSNSGRTRLATEADVLDAKTAMQGLSIKVGDTIGPAGIYAGDRDMFVFMVNENNLIDAGGGDYLSRGFFIENSEVGARSFRITAFLYRHVCGNHIVWGAEQIATVKIRHIGEIETKVAAAMRPALEKYGHASAQTDQQAIAKAKGYILGNEKRDVVVTAKNLTLLPAKTLTSAYDAAIITGDDPNTAWGLVQGLTQTSQQKENADRRLAIDTAAGKLMEVAQ